MLYDERSHASSKRSFLLCRNAVHGADHGQYRADIESGRGRNRFHEFTCEHCGLFFLGFCCRRFARGRQLYWDTKYYAHQNNRHGDLLQHDGHAADQWGSRMCRRHLVLNACRDSQFTDSSCGGRRYRIRRRATRHIRLCDQQRAAARASDRNFLAQQKRHWRQYSRQCQLE